jgi:hypothetical protein
MREKKNIEMVINLNKAMIDENIDLNEHLKNSKKILIEAFARHID